MYVNLDCPRCPTVVKLHLMSTTNEWKYKCPVCRHRFNEELEEMSEE